jgi:hypothetical protein
MAILVERRIHMTHENFKERGMYQIILHHTREELLEMGFAAPPEPFTGFTYGTHPTCEELGCKYCPQIVGPLPTGIGCED